MDFRILYAISSGMIDQNAEVFRPIAADPVSQLLMGMRMRGASYSKLLLSPPFGIGFPSEKFVRFHFVARGEAHIQAAGGGRITLGCGGAALLPHGTEHALLSEPGVRIRDYSSFPTEPLCPGICSVDARSETTCRSRDTLIFSGRMEFELDSCHPLITLMPDVLPVSALLERQSELRHLLDAMEREMAGGRAGSAGILARLSEVVAANIIREWVEASRDSHGWLAALHDRRLGRVLAALHRDPSRDWTIAEMAELMGSSRSVFAERFTTATGVPPLRYLATIRMHLATQWLGREGLPIDEVAHRLNYQSQAAFSRAFKKFMGYPPGRLRRRAGQPQLKQAI